MVSAPAGDFTLKSNDKPVVLLLSGGVGFTPMVSMLNTIVEQQRERKVTYIHGALNSDVHAMKEHVARLAAEYSGVRSFVAYSNPTEHDTASKNFDKEGFIDLEWLKSILPNNHADFYFCGPVPFMKVMNTILKEWGVPEENIHYEFFGPAGSLEEARETVSA